MVSPESSHALSSLSSLKQENLFAATTGMDSVGVVVILLVRGGLQFVAV